MASGAAIEAGRAFVRLFLKNDMRRQLVRALRAAQARLRNFGRSATAIGRQMAMVGAALALPIALSVRTFASFDDGMREVAGVTQAVGADFEMLTDKAKKLGASTSYTASEVALLMAELGRAGFAPQQIDTMTSSVLNLARATKTEAAQSAGIMAATIRQFGLEAEDAARVADVLTAGANKSFNTLESLGESLGYVGVVAKDFNLSLEDTVAVLGTLGNVGIQGSMAGTAMKRIMLALGADAKKVGRIFGVELVDPITGDAIHVVDALQAIAESSRGLGTAARAAKFKDAFGLRGITAASAIGGTITGTRELREEIRKAGDIAQKTADMMDSGLGGAFRILKSAIEGVQIALGEALESVLTKITKSMTAGAQAAIEWIKQNKSIVIAATAAAVGLIGFGVGLMGVGVAAQIAAFAIGGLTMLVSGIATVVGFLLTPLGAVTIAIGALMVVMGKIAGTALYRMWKAGEFEKMGAAFGVMADHFRDAQRGIVDAIQAGEIKMAFEMLTIELELQWNYMLAAMADAVTAFAAEVIPDLLGEAAKQIGKTIPGISTALAAADVIGDIRSASSKAAGMGEKSSLPRDVVLQRRMNKLIKEAARLRAAGKEGAEETPATPDGAAAGGARGWFAGMGNAVRKFAGMAAVSNNLVEQLEQRRFDARMGNLTNEEQTIARINRDYAKMLAEQEDIGPAEKAAIWLSQQQEVIAARQGFDQQRQEEQAQRQQALTDEIGAAQIRADKEGSEEQLALLEHERQIALRNAETEGERQLITQKFALQERDIRQQTQSQAQAGPILTATYSAAAASIAGYQPTGQGPEEQMAAGIDGINGNTKGILDRMNDWLGASGNQQAALDRFLASFQVQ